MSSQGKTFYELEAKGAVAPDDLVPIWDMSTGTTKVVAGADIASGGGGGPITITGDATGTGTGTIALTLANSGVTPTSVGSATSSARITVDAKGRVTAVSTQTIAPAWGSVTGKPTTFAGYGLTDIPSVRDYGIVADGTTDNTAAINAAWASLAAAGRIPLLSVPPGTGKILVTGALNPPAGAGLVGLFGRPTILMSGTTPSVVSQPDFRLVGLTLEGTHATQNYKIQITSTGALIADCTFTNWNSGLDITGNRNTVQNVQFVNVRGGGIRLRGSKYNSVVGVDGVNVTLFLVYLQDGAACNSVHRPMKRVDFPTLTAWQLANRAAEIAVGQFGIECVGITQDCYRNDVVDYYAEFTSDAGMSCSGYENTITGGRVIGCAGNALTFIGSRNTATGIVSIGNKRGVACIPTAGGLAKDNVAAGCVSIGDWFAGFTNEATQLRLWQSGVTLTPASSFIRYGLNNYQSTGGATGTYGTIAPTHTSGTASDGVNTWEWISSDPDTLDADRNMFVGCIARGSGTGTPGGGVTVPGGTGTGEQYYIEAGTGANVKIVAASDTSAETGGSSAWGGITGTLSAQTDLQAALDAKQPHAAVLTGTTASFTTAQESKLAGIATAATANATDAALRDRATHTGTQAAATITGLATVATSGAFADLTGKPTTLAGFGITDAYAGLAQNPRSLWLWNGHGAAGLTAIGAPGLVTVGSANVANPVADTPYNKIPKTEYLVFAAATNAVAGFRCSGNGFATVGGASAGLGGFEFFGIWGPTSALALSTHRAFFGMGNVTTPTDIAPSADTNLVGMGWDDGDTNIHLICRGAGSVTKLDLGASWPRPTTDRSAMYSLRMYSPPGPVQSVECTVTDLISGAAVTATLTGNLPGTGTRTSPKAWCSVGGTSSSMGIAVTAIEVKTMGVA